MMRKHADLKTVVLLLLGALVLYFFMNVICTLYLFPIYPDEIAERAILSRSWYDFPVISSTLRLCKSSMLSLPLIWYIPGTIDWIIHGHIYNLRSLRVVGISTNIIMLILLTMQLCYMNLHKLASLGKKVAFIFLSLCFVVACLEIGVMPFALIVTRPEQMILIWLVIMLIIFSIRSESSYATGKKAMLTIIYFISLLMILHSHPKTLFLTPIFLIVAHKLFSDFNSKLYYFLGFFLLMIILVANYAAWSHFYDCKNIPSADEVLKSFNINLGNIKTNPRLFFSEIKSSLLDFNKEIQHISFQTHAEVNYLPDIDQTIKIKMANLLLRINYIAVFIGLLLYVIGLNVGDILKRKLVTGHLLALSLLACAILSQVVNKNKHWYDAGYFWSIIIVVFIFMIADRANYLSKKKITLIIMGYLFCVSSYSMYIFTDTFKPYFLKGFVGPSLVDLSSYNYKKEEEDLKEIEKKCNIDVATAENLILDDSTYLHFQRSKYPFAITYLFFGASNQRQMLSALLDKYQMGGIILDDKQFYLPDDGNKKYAIHVGHYVCVPQSKTSEALWMYTRHLFK